MSDVEKGDHKKGRQYIGRQVGSSSEKIYKKTNKGKVKQLHFGKPPCDKFL